MTTPTDPTTLEMPENGHNGTQDGLNPPSGQREPSEGENGRETGAQRLDTHDAGPSVREAAVDDRLWWTDKYAGEGQ